MYSKLKAILCVRRGYCKLDTDDRKFVRGREIEYVMEQTHNSYPR